MDFVAALNQVFTSNARIARRVWNNSSIYCHVVQMQLCITGVDADGKPHPWQITESDYFADDWEVVE